MTTDIVSSLPNLGVGVAAIYALYAISKIFLEKIDRRDAELGELNKEIRNSIMTQLSEAGKQMAANTHVMTRIIDYLDRPDLHIGEQHN